MATNIIITKATVAAAETAIAPHTQWQIGIAAGAGIILAALLFKPFFRDWSGFWECIVFWMKPDWISWFHGEGEHDWWCELKLGAWVVISCVFGFLTFLKLPIWLPGFFGT